MKTLRPSISLAPAAISTLPRPVDPFYFSPAWKRLVAALLRGRGRVCQRCGKRNPSRIYGDHIVELRDGGARLDPGNVQLLCGSCHTLKTNEAREKRLENRLGR
jgi:5-methylcytosine-specific restriction enzyme A